MSDRFYLRISSFAFSVQNYWDQWPLPGDEMNKEELSQLYSIPDIDVPPSPSRPILASPPPATTAESHILDILTRPSPSLAATASARTPRPRKRKKKKKPFSEYRPPSPFSPKPDYKSMDIEQLKKHAMKYGLSTSLSKRRLVQVLDEIYNVTHQYETDTDFEFDETDTVPKKDAARTPPTPAVMPERKKPKKRPAVHQMSSSDENNVPDANDKAPSDEDGNHEGRFLELTVYELSSSAASSSSPSITGTPPATLPKPSPSKSREFLSLI